MPLDEPFLIFTRRLNELGIRYMVRGSVAAIFYGEPRMTNDVDIVVFLKNPELPGLVNAFPLEEFYCPPLEVMALEIERRQRGHFKLIHHETGFKCDVYPVSDALHRWGLSKARRVELDSDSITLAPPEYVIVRKLQSFPRRTLSEAFEGHQPDGRHARRRTGSGNTPEFDSRASFGAGMGTGFDSSGLSLSSTGA